MYKYNSFLLDKARNNRNKPTRTEKIFWNCVKNRRFRDFKFIRQFAYGPYIYDFYCEKLSLFVEIDGITHTEEITKQKDHEKESYAIENHFHLIRFTDEEILENIEKVKIKLYNIIDNLIINNLT